MYVSFLRGINVGGKNRIKMKDLVDSLSAESDFSSIKTYIQSGNILIQTNKYSTLEVSNMLQKHLQDEYNIISPVITFTHQELKDIIRKNPFPTKQTDGLFVALFQGVASTLDMDKVNQKKTNDEEVVLGTHGVYFHVPGTFHTSKLSNNLFEKLLEVPTTTRNWKTLNKVISIANETVE